MFAETVEVAALETQIRRLVFPPAFSSAFCHMSVDQSLFWVLRGTHSTFSELQEQRVTPKPQNA